MYRKKNIFQYINLLSVISETDWVYEYVKRIEKLHDRLTLRRLLVNH